MEHTDFSKTWSNSYLLAFVSWLKNTVRALKCFHSVYMTLKIIHSQFILKAPGSRGWGKTARSLAFSLSFCDLQGLGTVNKPQNSRDSSLERGISHGQRSKAATRNRIIPSAYLPMSICVTQSLANFRWIEAIMKEFIISSNVFENQSVLALHQREW